MRSKLSFGWVLLLVLFSLGFGQRSDNNNSQLQSRTYRMGFSFMASRPDIKLILKNIEIWSKRSDAAIHHQAVPWAKLLAGRDPEELVREHPLKLMEIYRSKKLTVAITVEPLDGLNRSAEAKELRDARRSIQEEEIQKLYTRYVLALAKLTKPDYLGLAAEVNLFKRNNGDPKVYRALIKMTNDTAVNLKDSFPELPLYVSVQVETAWGHVDKSKDKVYAGIDDVFKDYPFMNVLGLSSYPNFGWDNPGDLPFDYFSRLIKRHPLPVIFVEGGWSSESNPLYKSSRIKQAQWIRRLGVLLNEAKAEFAGLLMFMDVETDHMPEYSRKTLNFFSSMGLVDKGFKGKPALREWDALFNQPFSGER